MKRKVLAVVLCLTMAAAVLTGCGSKAEEAAPAPATEEEAPAAEEEAPAAEEEAPAAEEEAPAAEASGEFDPNAYQYGASISTAKNVFFVGLDLGYKKGFEEQGIDEANYTITDGQDDITVQIGQFEDMLQAGCDVLILNPVESDPVNAFEAKAVEAGVPVIYCDRGSSADGYTCFLQSDNVELGRMGGEYIINFLTEKYGEAKGNVVELEGRQGASPTIMRGQGFHEVIDPYVESGAITVTTQNGDFDQQVSLDSMMNILQANDEVDAVFGHNDDCVLGARKALESNDKSALVGEDGHVCLVGIDGTFETLTAIDEGKIDCTIAQNPMTMGMEAVRIATEILKGNTVDKDIMWELETIDKSNCMSENNWGVAVNNL